MFREDVAEKGIDHDQILRLLTSISPENSEGESYELESKDEYNPQNDDCSSDSDISNQDETDLHVSFYFILFMFSIRPFP